MERGISEDDIVAMQLGAPDVSGLTQRQQAYVDKITLKLSQVNFGKALTLKLPVLKS